MVFFYFHRFLCIFWCTHAWWQNQFLYSLKYIWYPNLKYFRWCNKLISLTVSEGWVRNVQLTNTWHLISIETYLWADKTGYLPDPESVQNPVWNEKSVFLIPMLWTENFAERGFKNASGFWGNYFFLTSFNIHSAAKS